jgi:hypothetical protein
VDARRAPKWVLETQAFLWNEAPRYMIRDRDRIYGAVVTRRLRAAGIRDKPIAPASHAVPLAAGSNNRYPKNKRSRNGRFAHLATLQ